MITEHLKYARYVALHKKYVFQECLKLGIPVRGLLHDLSKLMPDEWFPYARYFYGNEMGWNRRVAERGFNAAWLRHQHRNPHHHQHWIRVVPSSICKCYTTDGGSSCLDRKYSLRNFARCAGSYVLGRTSSMGGWSGTCVESTTRNITGKISSNTETNDAPSNADVMQPTQRNTASNRRTFGSSTDDRCWSTTGGLLQSARAVVNRHLSFWPWTISMAEAVSTDDKSSKGSGGSKRIDGQYGMGSRRSSGSSVTTATAPSASTGTVLIRKTMILRNDDGTVQCLRCGARRLRMDDGDTQLMPMPDALVREMLADWRGAGRAITGKADITPWLEEAVAKKRIELNRITWVVLFKYMTLAEREACNQGFDKARGAA